MQVPVCWAHINALVSLPPPPLSPENKEKEEDHSLTLRSCRQSLSEEEEEEGGVDRAEIDDYLTITQDINIFVQKYVFAG